MVFDTEQNLKNTKFPVLILHAKDDTILPYHLGVKVSIILITMFTTRVFF
jgi:predicted esterase